MLSKADILTWGVHLKEAESALCHVEWIDAEISYI